MKELLACQVYIRADAVQWYLWGSSNQAIWISNAFASCGELSLMSHDCASGAFFWLFFWQSRPSSWSDMVGWCPRSSGHNWLGQGISDGSKEDAWNWFLDARWHFKGLYNAGLLSFLWWFSTSNICTSFRLVGRLRTRQVEQPKKVKLLVAVATLVSQNTIPVRSYLCIIEFHEQQKGSSWSAHHRLGRQGPNPG